MSCERRLRQPLDRWHPVKKQTKPCNENKNVVFIFAAWDKSPLEKSHRCKTLWKTDIWLITIFQRFLLYFVADSFFSLISRSFVYLSWHPVARLIILLFSKQPIRFCNLRWFRCSAPFSYHPSPLFFMFSAIHRKSHHYEKSIVSSELTKFLLLHENWVI